MDNYYYYTMIGGPARMKPGVVPHKLECQGKRKIENQNREIHKRKRQVQELLQEKETCTNTEAPAIQQDEEDVPSLSLQDESAVPSTLVQRPTFQDKGLQAKNCSHFP